MTTAALATSGEEESRGVGSPPESRRMARRYALWLAVFLLTGVASAPWAVHEIRFHMAMRGARQALAMFVADNAVLELRVAEKLNSNSAEVQFLLGVANRKAGHLDDCRPHLTRAAELGWSSKSIRFQLTLLAFQAGDHQAEIDLKQSLSRPMSDHVAEETYESLALGYLSEYRINDADLALDYWLRWRPECIRAKLLRAEIYALTDQRDEQRELYRQVIASDPNNYAAHSGLAGTLLSEHNVEAALAEYRWCHAQWKNDILPQLGIAACFEHQGKLSESKKILESLLSRELPDEQRAHLLFGLAQHCYQERDFGTAVDYLSQAVRLDPYDQRAEYTLALCLARCGRVEEANQHTKRSKTIKALHERLADLEHRMLDQPDDADLRYQAGLTLAELGKHKASAAMMLAALRWNPQHAQAHAALAQYYEDIGRSDLVAKHEPFMNRTAPSGSEGEALQAATGTSRPQEN